MFTEKYENKYLISITCIHEQRIKMFIMIFSERQKMANIYFVFELHATSLTKQIIGKCFYFLCIFLKKISKNERGILLQEC